MLLKMKKNIEGNQSKKYCEMNFVSQHPLQKDYMKHTFLPADFNYVINTTFA